MFRSLFKKGMAPRGFDYVPRYWDKEKEEFDERIAELEKKHHGETDIEHKRKVRFNFKEDNSHVHGMRPSGDARFHRNYDRVSSWRIFVITLMLGALIYFMFVL